MIKTCLKDLMKEHPVDFYLLVHGHSPWSNPETDEEAGSLLLDLIEGLPHGPDRTIVLSALKADQELGWYSDVCNNWAEIWTEVVADSDNLVGFVGDDQLAMWLADKPYDRLLDKYWVAPGCDEEEPVTEVPADYYQLRQVICLLGRRLFDRNQEALEKRVENIKRKQLEWQNRIEKGNKLLAETERDSCATN